MSTCVQRTTHYVAKIVAEKGEKRMYILTLQSSQIRPDLNDNITAIYCGGKTFSYSICKGCQSGCLERVYGYLAG